MKFLQIWVLTDAENHTPRYNQIRLAPAKRNELRTIVAPEGRGGENTGWLHQDAWFSTLDLDKGHDVEYRMHTPGNGAYVFVIEGLVEVDGEVLGRPRRHGGLGYRRLRDQGFGRRPGAGHRGADALTGGYIGESLLVSSRLFLLPPCRTGRAETEIPFRPAEDCVFFVSLFAGSGKISLNS